MSGKEIKQQAWEAALSQLAVDYNAQREDFTKKGVTLAPAADLPGRRHYAEGAPFFQMATTGNGVVIAAHESLQGELDAWAREHLAGDGAGHWLFEYPKLRELDGILRPHGWTVEGTHHMFLPRREFVPRLPEGFRYRWYDREGVKAFYPNKTWPNAILERENPPRPDVIALAAFAGEAPAALCGASADGELLWQVGIDVLPPYRSRGLGRALVEALSARIAELGKVPFYGTAAANIHSQGIAVNCGFFPAWVEVSSRRIDEDKEEREV